MDGIRKPENRKVPAITIGFWIIKIAATTLGETAGDALSMTLNLGYAVSTGIFFAFVLVAVAAQIRVREFHPFLYWAVIVATTTAGTTTADYFDRSLGIGYAGGSLILFVLLLAVLAAWWRAVGTVSVNAITTPEAEAFYWATILFSNTLGTALGDFLADDGGLGYERGALVFAVLLAIVAAGYCVTATPRTLLFWSAFILTRPLGATLGDTLTKPRVDGGLALSRISSSAIIALFIITCVSVLPQRAGRHPGGQSGTMRGN
jgi:uncharacterized membrane-anchored protein